VSGLSRRRLDVVNTTAHPRYVVWELTLRCDHACTHCGSRAGVARETELSTEQALGVVAELAAMGTQELVLIGGEAYLHEGFLSIIEALRSHGITPVMTTGGRGIDLSLAQQMHAAGMQRVSVSIDGLAAIHDRMRARKGSFEGTLQALAAIRQAGMVAQANTNLNRLNIGDLEGLYEVLLANGVRGWQVQLTSPLGRAADRPDMLFQPFDLLDVLPRVAALKERGFRDGMMIMPGNNLGYFGPEEALLRTPVKGGSDHFQGCQAGRFVMGIESDGAVKGCPSLQTQHYVGGYASTTPIADIWNDASELAFARARTVEEDLWGFCQQCPYAETCMGGCSFTAHGFFGRAGNNPYCHFRAADHQRRGLRERLVATDAASGRPFDHGLFEIVVEPFDAPLERAPAGEPSLAKIGRKPKRMDPERAGA